MVIATNSKPSIQLEGIQFFTEINNQVFEDFKNIKNKYISVDDEKQLITIRKSFLKITKRFKMLQDIILLYKTVKLKLLPQKNIQVFYYQLIQIRL